MAQEFNTPSPKWNWTAKLIVGLTFVGIIAWLILRFQQFIGPMILAFILTYLSYPVARAIRHYLKLSWRLSVTLFYLLLVVIVLGLLTLGGLALLEQGQSLFQIVQQFITVTIPEYVNYLGTQVIMIGRYQIDLTKMVDPTAINQQILATVQPLLGQVGTLLTKVATSAVTFFSWVGFIVLIAYFLTAESGGNFGQTVNNVEIPGYANDLRILVRRLNQIWSAFLRGQFVLFALTVAIFSVLMTALGVHYSVSLAVLSGFGRFLPYIGPFIAWTTLGLVAYFQGSTIFGLSTLAYVIVVIGSAVVVDSAFDNFISPKFMGSSLKVHPAAVLVTALVAANFIGFVGVLVAAPALASLQLIGKYLLRKMFDLDPWSEREVNTANAQNPGIRAMLFQLWNRLYCAVRGRFAPGHDAPAREIRPK
ncbi:MAG TPA: AI-2E family transporter [Anaerolineaceae bacterium]|jgi:predicted PurR-regulated permease PerM